MYVLLFICVCVRKVVVSFKLKEAQIWGAVNGENIYVYMYSHMYIHTTISAHIYMYVLLFICVCVRKVFVSFKLKEAQIWGAVNGENIYVYMYSHMYIHTTISAHIYMYVLLFICVCVRKVIVSFKLKEAQIWGSANGENVYAYMYSHMYIYMYIYTYIHTTISAHIYIYVILFICVCVRKVIVSFKLKEAQIWGAVNGENIYVYMFSHMYIYIQMCISMNA
jgi:uncharacterized membrane protein HdeD (DUF308 family)